MFLLFERRRAGSTTKLSVRVDEAELGARRPRLIVGAVEPRDARRRAGERVDEPRERQGALPHQPEQDRDDELEADHAGRRLGELAVLLERRVRRVVGGDASIVPSASASRSAATSACSRSGGLTLHAVS